MDKLQGIITMDTKLVVLMDLIWLDLTENDNVNRGPRLVTFGVDSVMNFSNNNALQV